MSTKNIMAYLENDLIKLRALEPEDLDILYKWENDADLWKCGATIAPYSKYALKEYIADSRLDIFQSRQLRLMIIWKENNDPAGTIDLYDFDPVNLRAGIGILIDSAYRGKGIGKQALDLMKDYAFDFLLVRQLYAHVPKQNEISLKLFSKAGYSNTACLKEWIKTNNGFEDIYVMQLI
ncbi:MAG: GNAT family N-acetyltransferase [Candidatus Azobacteroides sp.]|nr:GNAT family N-acetyltransferase [Candidatus Azobacteroides sp.]